MKQSLQIGLFLSAAVARRSSMAWNVHLSVTLGRIDAIAEPFGLEAWHLMLPVSDARLLNRSLTKLVSNYLEASPERPQHCGSSGRARS